MAKDYVWCSACRAGHPIDGEPCPAREAAVMERERSMERQRDRWRRATNRGRRFRRCLVCGRVFDGGVHRRGRPSELCGSACREIREAETQRLRRAGRAVNRKRPASHGLRSRGVLRVSPEVLDFLDAFPDAWTYDDGRGRW